MKDSGVAWLGEIPAGWALPRAKTIFRLTNGRGNNRKLTLLAATQKHGMYPQELLESVVRVKEGTDLNTFRTVHKDDFVISLRSFQGGFERSDYEGVCSPAYQTFCAYRPIVSQYFKYLFKSGAFIHHLNSLTVGIRDGKNINYSDFASSVIPVPPLEEQRCIADYLDTKCAEIDRAIKAAEDSIEELNQYRISMMRQTVFRGKEGARRHTRPSGVDFMGDIPAEWKVSRVWRHFRIVKNIAGRLGFDVLAVTKRGLKVKEVTRGEGQLASDYSKYQIVEPGDYAMNHMDPVSGFVGLAASRGVTSPDYRVFRATEGTLDRGYYLYVFQLYYLAKVFYNKGLGEATSAWQRITKQTFLHCEIPFPPFKEQHAIADYLDSKCAEIASAISAKQSIIEDLKAYKQSLIYETVTGKREV